MTPLTDRTFKATLMLEELAEDGTIIAQRAIVKTLAYPALLMSSSVTEPVTNAYVLARELLADVAGSEHNRMMCALEFANALSYK